MKSLLCIVSLFATFSLSAQKLYFNLQTGFGFATEAGQGNYHNVKIGDNTETKELISGGLGEGVYLRASVLYKKNDWISMELGVNYLLGREIVTTEESRGFFPSPLLLITTINSRRTKAFIVTPQLVFSLPNESKLTPYVKTGFAIGNFMKTSVDEDFITETNFNQYEINTTYILNGGNPFGFTAALGTQYFINEKVSFIIDFNLLSMSYRPHKSTMTKHKIDGVNNLDGLSLRQREIIYNNKLENTGNINENEPFKALPISIPMSNVSFNAGLQVTF
ncbi:MAG: outer membrane beta-barrel protein [Saprospiraceae bacterium]